MPETFYPAKINSNRHSVRNSLTIELYTSQASGTFSPWVAFTASAIEILFSWVFEQAIMTTSKN
jgi:hypothetical protein